MTRTSPSFLVSIALLAVVAVLAGCGGTESTDGSTEPAPETDATTPITAPEPTTEPPPTEPTPTETTPTSTTQSPPRTIVIVVDQGRPRGGIKRPTLRKGENVVLVIRADVGDEVHIHGYDVTKALTPGKPARIHLLPQLAGRFEVELHNPDALLAVLEVRP